MKGHHNRHLTERTRHLQKNRLKPSFVAPIGCLLFVYFILQWELLGSSVKLGEIDTFEVPSVSTMAVSLIVVAPTFYTSLDETRYHLGVQACREAARHQVRLILVDASPTDDIRVGLQAAGRDTEDPSKEYVKVVRQTAKGRKGAALREAIQLAYQEATDGSQHHGQDSTVVIGFQELEKVDMFRHWAPLVNHMVDSSADVTVPRRADSSFQSHYPIEQYHCESFANLYLNSLGADIGLASIDWTMGPVAFRHTYAHHWIDFDGEMWDAQLVPLVKAHLAGAKVSSFQVDYFHPKSMKEEEEGVVKWNEKRLMQLNFLKDTVGKIMIDNAPSATAKS
jgi:hypothetical protein